MIWTMLKKTAQLAKDGFPYEAMMKMLFAPWQRPVPWNTMTLLLPTAHCWEAFIMCLSWKIWHKNPSTLSLCHQREYWWSLMIVFYGGLHLLPDGGAILDAWPWLGRRRWYVWDMDNCLKILWQITLSHSRYLEKYANLWDGSLLGWSVA